MKIQTLKNCPIPEKVAAVNRKWANYCTTETTNPNWTMNRPILIYCFNTKIFDCVLLATTDLNNKPRNKQCISHMPLPGHRWNWVLHTLRRLAMQYKRLVWLVPPRIKEVWEGNLGRTFVDCWGCDVIVEKNKWREGNVWLQDCAC